MGLRPQCVRRRQRETNKCASYHERTIKSDVNKRKIELTLNSSMKPRTMDPVPWSVVKRKRARRVRASERYS